MFHVTKKNGLPFTPQVSLVPYVTQYTSHTVLPVVGERFPSNSPRRCCLRRDINLFIFVFICIVGHFPAGKTTTHCCKQALTSDHPTHSDTTAYSRRPRSSRRCKPQRVTSTSYKSFQKQRRNEQAHKPGVKRAQCSEFRLREWIKNSRQRGDTRPDGAHITSHHLPGEHPSQQVTASGLRRSCGTLPRHPEKKKTSNASKRDHEHGIYVPDNPGPLLRHRLRYGSCGGVQLAKAREVLVSAEILHVLHIQKLKRVQAGRVGYTYSLHSSLRRGGREDECGNSGK